MLKIGMTGNIGAGKTVVCRLFQLLGIRVIYADELAKRLMERRLQLRCELINLLGPATYTENGSLDKEFVSKSIFGDPEKRQAVNKIVHKAVHNYLDRWFVSQKGPYAIEEAALIYESHGDQFLDKIIVVDAPQNVRMQRVMVRDGITEKEFLARDQAQMDAHAKVDRADFVIVNDNTQSLIKQVFKIHRTLVNISNQNNT
jgi:dephospho-CoA kinase